MWLDRGPHRQMALGHETSGHGNSISGAIVNAPFDL
jgi:hypothetical protein